MILRALQEAQLYISIVSDFCKRPWRFLISAKLYTLAASNLIFPSYLQNFAIAIAMVVSFQIR